ncbi:ferric reductase [Aspergillus tamarii]|uniref:Ferric reductase n=1 Tax=Aspergillus tamarii TaxID=41984 RepID=A0A5N6V8Q0_ASPTM|nr:ferric reductase [Aspergillus tamarii]
MYDPPCAFACRSSISNPLECSMSAGNGTDILMTEESPDPECYAMNDAFLQTLAYCMMSHCHAELNSTLQRYWEMNVAGSEENQPWPKVTYEGALASIEVTPSVSVNSSTVLTSASLVDEDLYKMQWRTLTNFERVETTHNRYGLVLLLTGTIIPIAMSLGRFIPFPAKWIARFEAYFLVPPLIGSRHNVPIFNMFNMPTRGQALFIAYLITINIILCAVGIESAQPNAWYASTAREVVTYVSNRVGVLSFANIPLLVLYSSRNNVLLWLTNWSHSTFLLLHRWVAVICVIEACLHSAIYLQIYDVDDKHSSGSQLPYWYWGIIATLGLKCYEFFLAWHIVLSLLALVGCFLHIFYRYAWQWGYENYIYIAFAIWAFEIGFRFLRTARQGICMAHMGKSSVLLLPEEKRNDTPLNMAVEPVNDLLEKDYATDQDSKYYRRGSLIFVRTHSGVTRHLRGPKSAVPVLVESTYYPASITGREISGAANIIAIAGGVGVTAVTPILLRHAEWHRLFWAVRSRPLVDQMAGSLGDYRFDRFNATIFQDQRMDISQVLRDEVLQRVGAEMTVVVSGPPKMADEVRVGVARLMRDYPAIKLDLVEESFSWQTVTELEFGLIESICYQR